MTSRVEEYNSSPLLVCISSYFLLVLIVNILVTYPQDNDLDEIGWLAANLNLSRVESLANANYPFGLPLLLKLLTPLFGGLLRSALILETAAAALTLYFSFRISYLLFASVEAAYLGLAFTAVLVFESATSEYADGLCVMLLYGGLFFLVLKNASYKAFFVLGLCVGAAYLFRYHYFSFILFISIASLVLRGSWREKSIRLLVYGIGVFLIASPQLAFNYLDHAHILSHPFQSYLIGMNIQNGFDWDDFLGTYNLWPLGRVLDETPLSEIFSHMVDTTGDVFEDTNILFAFLVLPLVMREAKDEFSKRAVLLLFLSAALYVAIIIAPTHYTNRSVLPITVLSGIFIGAGLGFVTKKIPESVKTSVFIVFVPISLYFITPLTYNIGLTQSKYEDMLQNHRILAVLEDDGKEESSEVYTNDWNIFPLDDPKFITYYNHGGWLLLDSKYARERPNPLRVNGLSQWEGFFREHGLRFAVLAKNETRYTEFYKRELPAPWTILEESDDYIIIKLAN